MKQRKLRRALDKQYVEGECVWNALLRGVFDLEGAHCTNHKHLLKMLQSKIDRCDGGKVALFERTPVQWNEELMTNDERTTARAAILELSVNTRGYDCRACDPLLLTVAAVFNIRIIHNMVGIEMVYSTVNPRRIVFVSSSYCHMVHEKNVDIPRCSSCPTTDGEDGKSMKGDATCSVCGLKFPSMKNMLWHRNRFHSQQNLTQQFPNCGT